VIENYEPLGNRNDVGELRENFLIIERMKRQAYSGYYGHNYFWRTYNQAEVDRIEEYDGKLHAFEFKRGKKNAKLPQSFAESYPEVDFEVVNRENFLEFVV
jgi:hypothetical protein